MNRIERLDVVGHEPDQLRHHRFHSRRIAGDVSRPHQHPVEPFVIRADQQPFRAAHSAPSSISRRQAGSGQATAEVDNGGFDGRTDTLQDRPVRGPKPFERPAPHQLQRAAATVPVSFDIGMHHEPVPIGADGVRQRQSAMRAGQMVEAVPCLPECPPGNRSSRMKTRRGHQPIRPQRSGPCLIGGTIRMHGQIDDEFLGPRPGEIPSRLRRISIWPSTATSTSWSQVLDGLSAPSPAGSSDASSSGVRVA